MCPDEVAVVGVVDVIRPVLDVFDAGEGVCLGADDGLCVAAVVRMEGR